MRILKEQIVLAVSVGMLVTGLVILLGQVQIYEQAYQSLGKLISHHSVSVEAGE